MGSLTFARLQDTLPIVMGMPHLSLIVVTGLLLIPAVGQAQVDASTPGRQQTIAAVERGFFTELRVGPNYILTPDAQNNPGFGAQLSMHMGYDLSSIFNLSLGFHAASFTSSALPEDVGGLRPPDTEVRTDGLLFAGTLRAQLALLTTQRNFLWIAAEGGLGLNQPTDDMGPVFGANFGFERFTKLRHFSVGLSAGTLVFLEPQTILSIFCTPMVKYTF